MTLLYFLHEPREAGFPEFQALAGELRAAGVDVDVRNGTGHYYMHSLVAQSYEAHAWLADHALSGLPAFDVVHFAGRGGLGYYAGFAHRQAPAGAAGRAAALVGSVGEPLLLQRERQGRGAAPRSVDEVEVNFIEREGARLLDHALVGSRDTLAWCRERGRALPAGARVAPLPLGAARGCLAVPRAPSVSTGDTPAPPLR